MRRFHNPSAWKLFLGFLVVILGSAIFLLGEDTDLPMTETNLAFNSAVKAPMFAIIAAALLIIGVQSPKRDETSGSKNVDWVIRLLGAISALVSGGFWLQDATDDNSLLFWIAVIALALVILLAVLMASIYFLFLWGLTNILKWLFIFLLKSLVIYVRDEMRKREEIQRRKE